MEPVTDVYIENIDPKAESDVKVNVYNYYW